MSDDLAPARGIYHGLLISGLMWVGLFTACEARAVDPECVGAVAPPPFTGCSWKIDGPVNFCSSITDTDGNDLVSGDLASCTLVVDGVPHVQLVDDPGVVLTWDLSGASRGSHAVEAYCTSATAELGEVWASVACVGIGKPSKPAKR